MKINIIVWLKKYIFWELDLLKLLGYDLELEKLVKENKNIIGYLILNIYIHMNYIQYNYYYLYIPKNLEQSFNNIVILPLNINLYVYVSYKHSNVLSINLISFLSENIMFAGFTSK